MTGRHPTIATRATRGRAHYICVFRWRRAHVVSPVQALHSQPGFGSPLCVHAQGRNFNSLGSGITDSVGRPVRVVQGAVQGIGTTGSLRKVVQDLSALTQVRAQPMP